MTFETIQDPTQVMPAMLRIQDGDYWVNLNMITHIEAEDEDSWEVYFFEAGDPYTFEEEDLERLQDWLDKYQLEA